MIADLQLFELFRWQLAVICTIYAGVVTWQSLWSWLTWFNTSRPAAAVGRYAGLLLLRIRMRPFLWELLQIAVLIALFGYIVHWNHLLLRRT